MRTFEFWQSPPTYQSSRCMARSTGEASNAWLLPGLNAVDSASTLC